MALQLKLDPSNLEAGAAKAKTALAGVQGAAFKAESAIDQMARSGVQSVAPVAPAVNRAKASIDAVGKSGFAAGGGVRMLGQQLSQVAQQGAVTGNYLGALAVQLPDMALGFGSVAIAASIVATVAMPLLITAFGDGKSGAEGMADANDVLYDSIDVLKGITADFANGSVQSLIDKYGQADTALLQLIGRQRDQAILLAQSAAADAVAALSGEYGNLLSMIDAGGKAGAANAIQLKNALGLTAQDALALRDAMMDAQTATDFNSQAAALVRVDALLAKSKINGSEFAVEITKSALAMREVENQTEQSGDALSAVNVQAMTLQGWFNDAKDAVINMVSAAPGGGWLSGAMGDADGLAAKLWNAFSAANATRLAMMQSNLSAPGADGRVVDLAALNAGGRGRGLPANVGSFDFGDAPLPSGGVRPAARPEDIDFGFTPPTAGSSGGGGAAAADNTREAYDRLMASLDPVVARTQDMAEATATVDAALASADITAAEHANAMDLIKDKYTDATTAMADLQETGGNAIDSLIDGTATLSDALKQMAKDLVFATIKAQLLNHVTGGTASMSIGGLLMQGITGGFHDAGGTIPMGTTGMVGERGPELVRATSGGAVVTSRVDTARQMSGQNVNVSVGVSVDDSGNLQAYVKKVSMAAAQSGAAQAVQQVRRSFGAMLDGQQRDGALA